MKANRIGLSGLLLTLCLLPITANAYFSANRWGGMTSHSMGSTSMSDRWGGSMTHNAGEGTSATGAYGGTAYHAQGSGQTNFSNQYGDSATHTYGEGTSASNAYGGSAYHAEGSGYTSYTSANGNTAYHSPYYGDAYPVYHPPAPVNYYGSGCYNCGSDDAGAAAVAGAMIGAAAGEAAASNQEAAANANAYAYDAGYNAAAGNTFPMGSIYAQLPSGCTSPPIAGNSMYFLCGNTWFLPSSGANGIFYRVVPAP